MSFKSDFYSEAKIITPDDGAHYFFGYYDLRATQGKRHLAHRVTFMDRLPEAEDIAQLGYLENGEFTPFAQTTAWNFQQGALLQYHPFLPDTVFYNCFRDGRICTVMHNYKTGEKQYTDRPAATIAADGKWALSVNFGRIYAFRAGYGYAAAEDPNKDVNAPADDGIFRTDMETGKSKLLVAYEKLAEICNYPPEQKILINHINFSPDSRQYVALLRNFPVPGVKGWKTTMLVGDLEGNVRVLLRQTYVSHYIWADSKTLYAHCSAEYMEKKSLYRISAVDGSYREYDMPMFHCKGETDLHCNTSPDGNYIIGDTYPRDGYRSIEAINLQTGACRTLFRAETVIPKNPDIRCDLHNRFVFDGTAISYDTTQNGCRQIAVVDMRMLNF